jgi:hypothetical protein
VYIKGIREHIGVGCGLYGAAHAVADAINERRIDGIAAMLHPDIRLETPGSAHALRGRGLVLIHLQRLFRDLRAAPAKFGAAEAVLPFDGRARHPCALIYDGPRRNCAICPGIDPGAAPEKAEIRSLTILTEPSLLAAADRLGPPGFRGGASAPPPLPG